MEGTGAAIASPFIIPHFPQGPLCWHIWSASQEVLRSVTHMPYPINCAHLEWAKLEQLSPVRSSFQTATQEPCLDLGESNSGPAGAGTLLHRCQGQWSTTRNTLDLKDMFLWNGGPSASVLNVFQLRLEDPVRDLMGARDQLTLLYSAIALAGQLEQQVQALGRCGQLIHRPG